jgi:hypothetical protein
MFSLSLAVLLRKLNQLGIASPRSYRGNASVNEHRTGFAGMVRSQLAQEVV